MPTLRLFMENFLTKHYPEQSYSYFGDLAKIRSYNTMKIFHPYYHIHFKDKPTICIVGIEPNIILYLCPEGIKKIQEFERKIQCSLLWSLESDGNVYGKCNTKIYLITYILTGLTKIKHLDNNPLNNVLDNLIEMDQKKMKQNEDLPIL